MSHKMDMNSHSFVLRHIYLHVPGLSCQSAKVRQSQPVPCGSARHLDFKKGKSGAPAKVSWSPKCPCGALAGLLATERRGRYSPQLEFFQGQIFAQKELQAEASATSGHHLIHVFLFYELLTTPTILYICRVVYVSNERTLIITGIYP